MVNLFYLDHDPKKCARYYCDKHVVKIPVEICQILSQIYHELGTKKPPYKRCKGISFNLNTFPVCVSGGILSKTLLVKVGISISSPKIA